MNINHKLWKKACYNISTHRDIPLGFVFSNDRNGTSNVFAWGGTARALKHLHRQSCKNEVYTIDTGSLKGRTAATGTLHFELVKLCK